MMRGYISGCRLIPALVFFSVFLSAAGCISKQNEGAAPVDASGPAEVRLGGFVPIAPDSPGAQRAYRFLKTALAEKKPGLELGAITKAASQVVAGVKIRIACEYFEGKGRIQKKFLTALVFIDPADRESLLDLKLDDQPKE